MPNYTYPHQHLLSAGQLSQQDILGIFERSETFIELNRKKDKKNATLKGRTLINLFFEDSTRTRTSFEIAGKRLGADVINMNVKAMAVSKGESLIDTASTINAMQPDFITMRHSESGSSEILSQHVSAKVINAGDGWNEHPTQALLDALTIKRRLGNDFSNKTVAIIGDILHSRVAGSNIRLLKTMGAKIKLIAPPTLVAPDMAETFGVEVHHDIATGLKDADVVMVLRLQRERMSGNFFPSEREYFALYGMDHEKLKLTDKDSLVMHPGPINRGLDISGTLADDIEKNLILEQVEMGVALRMAILDLMA
jgi:aspartate carbamoyltransferase catalytic subunit